MHQELSPRDYTKAETTQHLLSAMIELLHDSGFRMTNQRKLILEAVAAQVGWHVHPKDVFAYVQERDQSIGMATVYRTLKMLEDMDLLNKIYMMGMNEDHDTEEGGSHHFHMICLKCGKIEDISDHMLEEIDAHMKQKYGFETTQMRLSVYGLCEDCKRIAAFSTKKG